MEHLGATSFIHYDGKKLEVKVGGLTSTDELYIDFTKGESPLGYSYKMFVHPKQTILVDEVVIELDVSSFPISKIFGNGFQSWSESREFTPDESIPSIKGFATAFMGNYGDYHIKEVRRGTGLIHSWSYTYLRSPSGEMLFVGSMDEKTGFTLMTYNHSAKKIRIEKECKGLELTHSFPALEICILQGEDNLVFDEWFKLAGIAPPKVEPAFGWTSWYHYYTKINEEVISKNLAAFKENEVPIDIFQIDDGYQTGVGDWLSIDTQKFPKGMDSLASGIHEGGYKAGLWLAPFVCEAKSKLFKEHPEWILKDEKGKPVKAGYNPMWSGWFYALDIYHIELRYYLSNVFNTILNQWGYDMVKLDFLYAACILPRNNKTRGQVMADGMAFLREACGDKIILGCGVPLGQSFGLVDYCRIGADIHLSWEHKPLKFLRNRERVSTIVALRSVLGRWQLDRRAFVNDPDVFLLRDAKNKLTPVQQNTILTLNSILGNLIFTSDYIGDYSPEQLSEFRSAMQWKNARVEKVIQEGDLYAVSFTCEGSNFLAFANLSGKEMTLDKFNKTTLKFPKGFRLEAYETIVFSGERTI